MMAAVTRKIAREQPEAVQKGPYHSGTALFYLCLSNDLHRLNRVNHLPH
jgi:hypothetical protein